jgi:hypothetical protein
MTLSKLLEECLAEYTSDAASVAERVVDVAIVTEMGSRRGVVHLRGRHGLGGASSKKLRNAIFNWRKLLADIVGGGFKSGMNADNELVIVLACLQFLNKFHQRMTIELKPEHAVLVWCLGAGTDLSKSWATDDLMNCVNPKLSAAGKAQLSASDLRDYLAHLEQLQTVRSPAEGEWILCETVRFVA